MIPKTQSFYRALVFSAALMSSGPSVAGEWPNLTGDQITALLNDTRLEYDGAWQEFYASGKTLYNAGRDSWGNWRVQGNLYCSEWPPNAGWDCYAMTQRGDVVRFIDERGNVSEGVVAELK